MTVPPIEAHFPRCQFLSSSLLLSQPVHFRFPPLLCLLYHPPRLFFPPPLGLLLRSPSLQLPLPVPLPRHLPLVHPTQEVGRASQPRPRLRRAALQRVGPQAKVRHGEEGVERSQARAVGHGGGVRRRVEDAVTAVDFGKVGGVLVVVVVVPRSPLPGASRGLSSSRLVQEGGAVDHVAHVVERDGGGGDGTCFPVAEPSPALVPVRVGEVEQDADAHSPRWRTGRCANVPLRRRSRLRGVIVVAAHCFRRSTFRPFLLAGVIAGFYHIFTFLRSVRALYTICLIGWIHY
mmetsp:Transcript_40933/g.123465  ORF Transcript_40933/g.123465 Transcript_40933/m.123465 type:complete len:290 (-) Transcript_40933:1009-1878(-)